MQQQMPDDELTTAAVDSPPLVSSRYEFERIVPPGTSIDDAAIQKFLKKTFNVTSTNRTTLDMVRLRLYLMQGLADQEDLIEDMERRSVEDAGGTPTLGVGNSATAAPAGPGNAAGGSILRGWESFVYTRRPLDTLPKHVRKFYVDLQRHKDEPFSLTSTSSRAYAAESATVRQHVLSRLPSHGTSPFGGQQRPGGLSSGDLPVVASQPAGTTVVPPRALDVSDDSVPVVTQGATFDHAPEDNPSTLRPAGPLLPTTLQACCTVTPLQQQQQQQTGPSSSSGALLQRKRLRQSSVSEEPKGDNATSLLDDLDTTGPIDVSGGTDQSATASRMTLSKATTTAGGAGTSEEDDVPDLPASPPAIRRLRRGSHQASSNRSMKVDVQQQSVVSENEQTGGGQKQGGRSSSVHTSKKYTLADDETLTQYQSQPGTTMRDSTGVVDSNPSERRGGLRSTAAGRRRSAKRRAGSAAFIDNDSSGVGC